MSAVEKVHVSCCKFIYQLLQGCLSAGFKASSNGNVIQVKGVYKTIFSFLIKDLTASLFRTLGGNRPRRLGVPYPKVAKYE